MFQKVSCKLQAAKNITALTRPNERFWFQQGLGDDVSQLELYILRSRSSQCSWSGPLIK